MKNAKEKALKLAVKQIKNIAFAASGVTSYWLAYQPKEPRILKK
jgi:cyclic lactone autoinducer peptide